MKLLLLSDTHFSDRPRDAFKFGIFDWVVAQVKEHFPNNGLVVFAGDLTEFKDRHSAVLVNTIVEGMRRIAYECPVAILKANHDYIDPENPFFGFLGRLDNIYYYNRPSYLIEDEVAMIPHYRTQAELDQACSSLKRFKVAIAHQTFEGAISETGARLSGLKWLRPQRVYSGDIHKPQKLCQITYIGSPWHNRFGDSFTPRVLLTDESFGAETDLHFPAPKKWVLRIRDAEGIIRDHRPSEGDHVRVELQLTREELVEWPNHKEKVLKYCQARNLEVFGVELKVPAPLKREGWRAQLGPKTNEQILNEFCLAENVPNAVKEVGYEVIKQK